jgi:prepilin-type N-terminal cleavage/methylation domain-containing protein
MTNLRRQVHAAPDTGFTLIELLIVIVILGILAGIAIFAVGAFQSQAKTACTNANNRIDATVSAANSIGAGTYSTNGSTCAP